MMNRKDHEIIAQLRKDARMSVSEISRKTGIPVSTVHDRLKSLEKLDVVWHKSIVDYTKLGYLARINIALKIPRDCLPEAQEYLSAHPSINSLFLITGDYDLMLDAVFRSMYDYHRFIEGLESRLLIEKKQVHFVVEEVKHEDFTHEEETQ